MNQNESVQTENVSWTKFHIQDQTWGKTTGLGHDFAWNTSAESFTEIGHKTGVEIDEKISCVFFLPFLPHYSSLLLLYGWTSFLNAVFQSCSLLGPKQKLETVPGGVILSCYIDVFLGTIVMTEDFD